MDEEKKVEAVRDFYENAVGDDVAVERLQAVGIKNIPLQHNQCHTSNDMCVNSTKSSSNRFSSARIWVPASVLAFAILYWGYGLSFFFEMM